jgi:hypothetical protein
MLKWRTAGAVTLALMLLASFLGAFTATTAPASATAPLDDQAVLYRACVSRLNEAPARPLNATRRAWLQTCRDVFAPAASSPSPTASPSASPSPTLSPSASPTPTVSPTPSPTIPGPSVCPPLPAFPDEHCTGFAHTGVAEPSLAACPTRLDVAGAVYDRCRFNNVIIAADNIKITRSLVVGTVQGVNGNNQMRGLTLIDVEIRGVAGGTDQLAAIGTDNYSCLRCHVHGGYRGFGLSTNVRIVDSYAHGFRTQANAHQTAASTHGGTGVFIDHSRLRCQSNKYACSNGVSFYAANGNIVDVVIQNSHISTDAGYGIGFFYLSGDKPYDVLNVRILGNTFGSWEYGMQANFPGGRDGNVWSGNVQVPFDPGCRC